MSDSTTADIKYIKEKLDILCKVVVGNGDPEKGLVTRFTRLEDSVHNCQAAAKERRANYFSRRTALLIAGVSFCTALCMLVIGKLWK